MTLRETMYVGLVLVSLGTVVGAAYVLDPSTGDDCTARGGKWSASWKYCTEMDAQTRCALFCKSQGLEYKSYKNGSAIMQDESCECAKP